MDVLAILNAPWAIVPERYFELCDIYARHTRGEKADLQALEAQLGRPLKNERQPLKVVNGIAILSLQGLLAKRMNLFTEISGGTSTEILLSDFKAALADPSVHSILLDVDSPGGEVDGTHELARQIFRARGQKPVVALGSSLMASAAYWIASAADKLYISGATTAVGSIGVVARHVDVSRANQARGVEVTLITAGKYKAVGSPYAPLTPADKSVIQEEVDDIYSVFVNEVAEQRGVSVDTVLQKMADGRIFIGAKAVAAGLVDAFGTMEDLLSKLSAPSGARGGVMAGEAKIEVQVIGPEEIAARESTAFNRGQNEGARLERERIAAVEEVGSSLPGHEALVKELKFDGKTTAAEASQRLLAAEKEKRARVVTDLRADAPKPVPAAEAPEKPAVAEASLPLEERCKLEWDRSAALREEFSSLAAYTAFQKANAAGKVRIFSGKEARSA